MPYISQNLELNVDQNNFEDVFRFENTTARRLFVNKFDLIPNTYFANYGLVQVLKNGFPIFETRDIEEQNPLNQYSSFPIRQKLLFLDPHDVILIRALILEDEQSKLTVSYVFDFTDDPAPDILIPFSLAEKTITSRKTTLFPEKYYEQTLNEPHYSIIDNPNYNNMQISIDANTGYNPNKIFETQTQKPLDLSKFQNAYRGNNSPLRKVGTINNEGGLVSFVYEEEGEREQEVTNVGNLRLKTPFILNPDPPTTVFNFNHDGSKLITAELTNNGNGFLFKEYNLTKKFDVSESNRTFVAEKTVGAGGTTTSLQGLYFDPDGMRFFIFRTVFNNTQSLNQYNTTASFSVANLINQIRIYTWQFEDTFLHLTINQADGFFYFLSINNTDIQARLTVRKITFNPSNGLSNPTVLSTDTGFYTRGNTRNIIDATFSADGKVLFFLTRLKSGADNEINSIVLAENFMFPTNLESDFNASFEYSKIFLDFSDYVILAKNSNFTINEWFLFDIELGRGWAFYDENNELFHPRNVTGQYTADITKFDTKNESGQTRSYLFTLTSSDDFQLDVTYSYLQSISRNHTFTYRKRPRPLPTFPQTYDIEESITNNYTFKGKRLYTENRNVLRVFASDDPGFPSTDFTFVYEENDWNGSELSVNISTDKKYIQFEKVVYYRFLIEDYSETLEQADFRTGRVRTLTQTLINKYSDAITFINSLGPGREFLPNRYMAYYDQVLPLSFQQYAPNFLKKNIDIIPQDSIFDFSVFSRLPLPSGNITIGLEIYGENGNWYPLLNSIGTIKPIGRTLIQLKQFDPQNNLVLPKGKNVLRASLKSDQKVKLSVLAILS